MTRTGTVEEMLAQLKGYEMNAFEKRAQKISWAVGQVLCQSRYAGMPKLEIEAEEWRLRLSVARAIDEYAA